MSEQLYLFASRSPLPEGLATAPEFISQASEQTLIAHVAALPLQPFQFDQYEGKRRARRTGRADPGA
jgi:hypothetical protein